VSAEAHAQKKLLGGRAIKGGEGYGRRSDYQTCTRVPYKGRTGEMSGESPCAEARAPVCSSFCVSRPPPPALEVTGDLDTEERRVDSSGNDLGAGLRDAAAGSTSYYHVKRGFLPALEPQIGHQLQHRFLKEVRSGLVTYMVGTKAMTIETY
jgi:hypothetical protein